MPKVSVPEQFLGGGKLQKKGSFDEIEKSAKMKKKKRKSLKQDPFRYAAIAGRDCAQLTSTSRTISEKAK